MIQVSAEGTGFATSRGSALRKLGQLLSVPHIKAAGAVLMFAGCLSLANSAQAQAPAEEPAMSCSDKCTYEQKKCLAQLSTEELCEYDYKQCEKACAKQ
ncbi:MAG: hypothetical protein L0Y57_01125 [Beijerinckiaceae bacterium]|nr:hypothetical protein [Beijerinckiaceae bacterium]MCI0600836.1 hypothetical protein [Beijerinckiaceae bacterium]